MCISIILDTPLHWKAGNRTWEWGYCMPHELKSVWRRCSTPGFCPGRSEWWLGIILSDCIKCSISPLFVVVKTAWVVLKRAEWWLKPTTPDQCGQESWYSNIKFFFFFFPALGLAFVPLGSEGLKIDAIKFKFNMYTGPGYLSAFLGVIIIILLIFVFRESKLTNARKRAKMRKAVEYEDGSVQSNQKIKHLLSSESSCV